MMDNDMQGIAQETYRLQRRVSDRQFQQCDPPYYTVADALGAAFSLTSAMPNSTFRIQRTRVDYFDPAAPKLARVRQGIEHLKLARECFREAGAKRTLERVRLALTSAGGAERHATLEPHRLARQEKKA